MKTWKNLRIRTLIEENQGNDVLRQCTSLLDRSDIKSNISHRVSVQDLIDAYEQESASSNPGRPVDVDGFSELLSALRETDESYLRLVTLKTEREDTVVFTDPNLNQVVGALRILRARKPSKQPATLTKDQEFFNAMGPEIGPQTCREPGCSHLRVSGSVRCRNHLFEMVKGRPYGTKLVTLKMASPEKSNSNGQELVDAISALT